MSNSPRTPYYLCVITVLSYLQLMFTLYAYNGLFPQTPHRMDVLSAFLRIREALEDPSSVAGVAEAADEKCDHFRCSAGHGAVHTTRFSVDDFLNGTHQRVYCRCVPLKDQPFLNMVLRMADLTNSFTALQIQLGSVAGQVHNLQAEAPILSRRFPQSSKFTRVVSKRALFRKATFEEQVTNFTYVPPPKTDITPALLAESLAVQPQDTATVGSIMPHFQDGVISYGVQLNGLIAATTTLNASTALPCADIGVSLQTQPDLVLRPRDIDNGTAQPYLADCNIIAVNMYNPNVINYWVMNPAGAIFSLVGSNKLMQINQLNSTASTSLVLRATLPDNSRRDTYMTSLDGTESVRRAMSQPDLHTATMSAEACAAITCNNNGGKPAVFNPFTKTC